VNEIHRTARKQRSRESSGALIETSTIPIDPGACRLLRTIARLPNVPSGQVALLAGQVADWETLLLLAQEHRVLPLLYLRLSEAEVPIPPDALSYLRIQYECNVVQSMSNAAELIDLLNAFNQSGIPAMPFKGVVLSAYVYHDLASRAAGDLDILIRHQDLQVATGILLAKGYKRVTPKVSPEFTDDSEDTFQRESDGMVTELRWKLGLQKFKRDLGLTWVWKRRRTAVLASAVVPNLDPEIMLLILCMHGAKHMWSRLIWISDVAHLLANHPDLDWSFVIHEAKAKGLARPLALGVLLAQQVSGVTVPESILERFRADKAASKLSKRIEITLFDSPGNTRSSRVPYFIRILSFRDSLRAIFSLRIFQPNERDSAFVPLPRSLHALYYLIRPVRILLDRSPRH
jgi:hypothetical protein